MRKVVTRWENGRVNQGRTADVALRLLEMEPDLLPRLRKALARSRSPKVYPLTLCGFCKRWVYFFVTTWSILGLGEQALRGMFLLAFRRVEV